MVVVDYFFNSGAVFIFHIGFPELYGIFDPAFSNSACADAESMFQSFINMKFSRNPHCRQSLQSVLHRSPRGNAVI